MKKFIFTGIIMALAMFVITCETDLPVADDVNGFVTVSEDVMVSKDGSQVMLFLDGAKAPRTASRAMNSAIAQMSFDYFEVIFIGAKIARTAWELGEPAGISGVSRDTTYETYAKACMFVGKKDGKTLLGVGKLTHINGTACIPATAATFEITSTTTSVTFTVSPVQAGLIIAATTDEISTTTFENPRGVVANSFTYVTGAPTGALSAYQSLTTSNSSLRKLGGVEYPSYALPTVSATAAENVVWATYTFSFKESSALGIAQSGATGILTAVKHTGTPKVQKRTPRFFDPATGRYAEPKGDHIDTRTSVNFRGTYSSSSTALPTANSNFVPLVPLEFVVKSSGIFSFYIEIPVYMVDTAASSDLTLNKKDAIIWKIRTGLGADLYNLDDGASSGGCVLMGSGVSGGDWIDIEWDWL